MRPRPRTCSSPPESRSKKKRSNRRRSCRREETLATATARPTPAMPASRWPYLLAYLAAVIVAEVLITIPGGSTGQSIGLSIHILLVFTLMFLSVLIQPKDATLAPLLVAASLASLVRVFSLAVPRYNFLGLPGPSAEPNPLTTVRGPPLLAGPLPCHMGTVPT